MIMPSWKSSRWMRIAALAIVAVISALTPPNETAAQEQPAGISPAPPSTTETGRDLLQHKLHSMIIDKVNFDKMDIVNVIQFLAAKSKELDPDKEGVNFVMSDPANFTPEDHVHREVTIALDNVPMDELLGYIAEQTNLQYRVEDYAVYLHPAVDKSETLAVRVYKVPPNFFSNLTAPSEAGSIDVKQTLIAKGIVFPVGAMATFFPESSKLVVRSTPNQLDWFAAHFEANLHPSP